MAIDKALRASAWPNTRTLSDQIGVNRRTILRDIDYLRFQLNAPIAWDGVRNGYCYTEPTFRALMNGRCGITIGESRRRASRPVTRNQIYRGDNGL
jgi:hypothetical protein